jgi:hypothetical protein
MGKIADPVAAGAQQFFRNKPAPGCVNEPPKGSTPSAFFRICNDPYAGVRG